jgi:hypothetical protein
LASASTATLPIGSEARIAHRRAVVAMIREARALIREVR